MPDQQQRPRPPQQQRQYVTRTRQDLINTGHHHLFRREAQAAAAAAAADGEKKKFGELGGSNNFAAARQRPRRRALECCHSLCQLTLVLVSVISLFLLVRFLQDEPLYEYGEYLLGLSFYPQLIFVLALTALVLLLPLCSFFGALLLAGSAGVGQSDAVRGRGATATATATSTTTTTAPAAATNFAKADELGGRRPSFVLKLRLAYALLLFALSLLALVFVVPYVSRNSVASRIELEFRRHLKMRYESEFHYRLLDRLQEAYECCDHLWYRANLQDKVPISCFKPGSNFELLYDDPCPLVLGELVSTRCALLAACLLATLLALVCLFAIDCERLLSSGGHRRGEYLVTPSTGGADEPEPFVRPKNARDSNALARTSECIRPHALQAEDQDQDRGSVSSMERMRRLELDDNEDESEDHDGHDHDHDHDGELAPRGQSSQESGAREFEDERQVPLLGAGRQQADPRASLQSKRSRFFLQDAQAPIVLARADYKHLARDRSQSPVFLAPTRTPTPVLAGAATSAGPAPIRSALKSGGSQQSLMSAPGGREGGRERRNDRDREDDNNNDDDDDDESLVSEYTERLRKSDSLLHQKQLLRREQLRKSLQSVRFADDNS